MSRSAVGLLLVGIVAVTVPGMLYADAWFGMVAFVLLALAGFLLTGQSSSTTS